MAFASFDTYYFLLSCSLQDIGATLLSSPWQQPLVMLPSPAQTQELSRQITANKQHGSASNRTRAHDMPKWEGKKREMKAFASASNWKKARDMPKNGKAKSQKGQKKGK